MLRLRLTFQTVTPLFLGDADQNTAVLRPPAFKGLLRFWYRAADPQFREHERRFFGGIGKGEGQSNWLLSIDAPRRLETVKWRDFQEDRFRSGHGRETKNGLVYLGFPLKMGKKEDSRAAIAPGQVFSISCIAPRPMRDAERCRQAVLSAFWLLAHFGGIGTRSRRGFGGVSLIGWDAGGGWPEINDLPLVANEESSAALGALRQGCETIRQWFGTEWKAREPHPHMGPEFRYKLVSRSHQDWAEALAGMGRSMQEFRLRRAPDYQEVKDHLARRRPLMRAPQRTTFGLPLTFRYSSLPVAGTAELRAFRGEGSPPSERHGSLLFLRLLRTKEGLVPQYVRMAGAVPGMSPQSVLKRNSRPLHAPEQNAMDDYFASIEAENG